MITQLEFAQGTEQPPDSKSDQSNTVHSALHYYGRSITMVVRKPTVEPSSVHPCAPFFLPPFLRPHKYTTGPIVWVRTRPSIRTIVQVQVLSPRSAPHEPWICGGACRRTRLLSRPRDMGIPWRADDDNGQDSRSQMIRPRAATTDLGRFKLSRRTGRRASLIGRYGIPTTLGSSCGVLV